MNAGVKGNPFTPAQHGTIEAHQSFTSKKSLYWNRYASRMSFAMERKKRFGTGTSIRHRNSPAVTKAASSLKSGKWYW